MDTEMACYESFAEVTEDYYCSSVDVLKILVLRLHDYHARCFYSLLDALYLSRVFYRFSDFLLEKGRIKLNPQQLWIFEKDI